MKIERKFMVALLRLLLKSEVMQQGFVAPSDARAQSMIE